MFVANCSAQPPLVHVFTVHKLRSANRIANVRQHALASLISAPCLEGVCLSTVNLGLAAHRDIDIDVPLCFKRPRIPDKRSVLFTSSSAHVSHSLALHCIRDFACSSTPHSFSLHFTDQNAVQVLCLGGSVCRGCVRAGRFVCLRAQHLRHRSSAVIANDPQRRPFRLIRPQDCHSFGVYLQRDRRSLGFRS